MKAYQMNCAVCGAPAEEAHEIEPCDCGAHCCPTHAACWAEYEGWSFDAHPEVMDFIEEWMVGEAPDLTVYDRDRVHLRLVKGRLSVWQEAD